jgi:hypothetical protein
VFERLPVLFQSAMYALRGGFLIRPLVIAVVLGAVGAIFSSVEEAVPQINAWIPTVLFPSREDPGVAQVILSSIATSIMTVFLGTFSYCMAICRAAPGGQQAAVRPMPLGRESSRRAL